MNPHLPYKPLQQTPRSQSIDGSEFNHQIALTVKNTWQIIINYVASVSGRGPSWPYRTSERCYSLTVEKRHSTAQTIKHLWALNVCARQLFKGKAILKRSIAHLTPETGTCIEFCCSMYQLNNKQALIEVRGRLDSSPGRAHEACTIMYPMHCLILDSFHRAVSKEIL